MRAWILVGLAIVPGFLGQSRGGTEFGGNLVREGPSSSNLVESLRQRGGFTWIRGHARGAVATGIRWIDDVRHYQSVPAPESGPLPGDLFEVYRACRERLPAGDGAPAAWEVWNEPDFYFVSNNASDMAAVLKAAWWGIKSRQPEATVLMPSLAFAPSRYALELAHNGVARWTEGWNVHFYGWSADYPDFLAQHRAMAKALGMAAPLWVTEIGYHQLPRTLLDDADALNRQAAFHERVMVESWLGGVERHLVFALDPFPLASYELGMSDGEGRWFPALASSTAMARRLAGTRPRWRLVHQESGACVGVVLEESDGQWWTVLWSPGRPRETLMPRWNAPRTTPERLRLSVRWPRAISEVQVGLDALTALAPQQIPQVVLTPERNLHWRTPPVRFALVGCRWEAIEVGSDGAEARGIAAPRMPRGVRRELASVPPVVGPRSPVVARWRAGRNWALDKPSQSQQLARGASADGFLDLHNFGSQAVRGHWELDAPKGWHCQPLSFSGEGNSEASVAVSGLERIEVPAGATVSVPFRIGCDDSAPSAAGRMRVRWMGDDGIEDAASIRWQPVPAELQAWHRFGWRDFLARGTQPEAWQIFETQPGEFALEIRRPGPPQQDAAVTLGLPRGVRRADRFCARVKAQTGANQVFGQLFLVTEDGGVWRHGEWEALAREGTQWRAALEDFAPTIWSRHRSMITPPVSSSCWLVMRFQGLEAGQVLEISEPALCREARRSEANR